MMDADLPPLIGSVCGPSACATVRLYLAVLDDVPPEQAQLVFAHVKSCAECRAELRLLRRVALLAADSAEFAPPSRVDQVVMAAITLEGQAAPLVLTARFMRERHSPWL